MEKNQILQEGLKQLNEYAGHTLNLTSNGNLFELVTDGTDNHEVVTTGHGSAAGSRHAIFIQPWAPQKDINALISQMKSMSAAAILFANFINPVMAEKFRRRGIFFVDCAGNLSLKNSQFDFYVKRKKLAHLGAKRVRGRAFNSAGLKLIFAIFNQPELLHATYRDISKKVNIALGSVGPVMEDLYNSGYILEDGQRRLVNKKRLFERWVDGYLEKLRPKQILSCYRADSDVWWKTADPGTFDGLWGGDVAIARSTPFMLPETISLYFYAADKHRDFADYYGLQRDDEGDICIYQTFWSGDQEHDGISPMVMYADIVDSINPGSWDVAKTFYGEAVAHLLTD